MFSLFLPAKKVKRKNLKFLALTFFDYISVADSVLQDFKLYTSSIDFLDPITGIFILFLLYLGLFIWGLNHAVKIYIKKNIVFLTYVCKCIQSAIKTHQVVIFVITNIIVFAFLCLLFDPMELFVVHILILDLYLAVHLSQVIGLPLFEFMVISILIAGVLKNASFYMDLFCVLSLLFYVWSVLDSSNAFSSVKPVIQTFRNDQVIILGYKKDELFMFYTLEKTCVLVVLIFFVVPATFDLPPYFVPDNEDFNVIVKIYLYSFIFVTAITNLVIIHLFNPGNIGPKMQTGATLVGRGCCRCRCRSYLRRDIAS